ncbi:MAG TPA: hypothetical protein VET69_14945 [Terriglobales bacterium]|nr:hypothetical protein [Terriglobales bacterium]
MQCGNWRFVLKSDHPGTRHISLWGKALVMVLVVLAQEPLQAASSSRGTLGLVALGLGRVLLLAAAVFCLWTVNRRRQRTIALRDQRMAVMLASAVREGALESPGHGEGRHADLALLVEREPGRGAGVRSSVVDPGLYA